MPDLLERLKSALADRYAIESEIGRGGMAVVYLAEDLRHGRRVAIKVLHPELTATLGHERFLQEIKTVASLQHPHILPLYDSGEADGLLYYVMPFAEGESLRQRLDREGQLSVDESLRIAIEVADGLDYAHRKGVVHRDIKPGNILLTEGHATIADFGLARAIAVATEDRMTSTGLGVGTPLYASPEQATAQETLDGRTDIYSLGCVVYEMLAGEPPLTGATPKMIHARRMSETPTPLHSVRDTVTPTTDHAVARALARVPADRYATAAEFRKALQGALLAVTPAGVGGTVATADLSTPKQGTSRWRRLGMPVVAGVVIVTAAALLWLWGARGGRGPMEITVSSTADVTNAPGVEYLPAISPDGNEVAYVASLGGSPQVFVRSTTESGGGILPAQEEGETQLSPSWTSDGSSIRFCDYSFPRCDWK
ncbi:MAG: protein kinase, partial [Gemmatimonadota bacterium]